jgi:hypothetical protein
MPTPSGLVGLERISHRAALLGRVLDALTQLPLAGAEVTITSGPAAWIARRDALRAGRPGLRPERTVTDDVGFFKYLDLPAGSYGLQAVLPGTRYGSATATTTVATTVPAALTFTLVPTALTGTVNASTPAGPLAMACVRVVDSGELVYTAVNGSYTLSPLEPGTNRRIEISAQRYATVTITVTLTAGQTTTRPPITLTYSP